MRQPQVRNRLDFFHFEYPKIGSPLIALQHSSLYPNALWAKDNIDEDQGAVVLLRPG